MLKYDKVEEALQFVKGYAPEISEWKVLKKELLKFLPFVERKLFSTRDPVTKIQNFNEFEKTVLLRWKEITGVTLIFNEVKVAKNEKEQKNS